MVFIERAFDVRDRSHEALHQHTLPAGYSYLPKTTFEALLRSNDTPQELPSNSRFLRFEGLPLAIWKVTPLWTPVETGARYLTLWSHLVSSVVRWNQPSSSRTAPGLHLEIRRWL